MANIQDIAEDEFDAVVVGMGPGGESVANSLVDAGLSVLGIDHRLLGGECPYWGCVPSKMMVRGADLLAEARRVDGMAGQTDVVPDWAPVALRIRDEATDDWDDTVAVDRFEGKGGTFLRGTALVTGPRTVEVEGRTWTARRALVIGAGTEPAIPPVDGLDRVDHWDSRDAMEVEDLPPSLVVLGGGPIGCEVAQLLARFGVRVTVVEVNDRLLAAETPGAGQLLDEVFSLEGIEVILGARPEQVTQSDGEVTVALADGRKFTGARLLVATGRSADLAGLGLASVGVPEDARFLPVDEHLRVTDGVWGLGDITGKGPFTHVSTYQAGIVAADILGRDHTPADYRALPRVTFTDPEIGAVGRTPEQAAEEGMDVRTGRTELPSVARGWIHKAGNDGFIELVEDRDRGVLVGATSAGPAGGEVLGLLTLAVHAEVPVDALRTMIYAYPTFHRGVEDALRDLGR